MGSRNRRVNPAVPSPLRFYHIILQDTIQSEKLVIPKNLFKGQVANLPNTVLISVPCGTVWPVQVQVRKSTLQLRNGWKDFAEHYSLKYGHLILFEYDGHAEFRVLIHDTTATEIEYPPLEYTYSEDDESDSDFVKPEVESDDGSTEIPPMPVKISKKGKQSEGTSARRPSVRGLNNKQKREAFKRAISFVSKKPHVMVVMQPRYVVTKYDMAIPLEFARTHLGEDKRDITLCRDHHGTIRTWDILYRCYFNMDKEKANFGWGWKKFVLDNKLKVGDVCVFELINKHDICLKVSVY